MPDTHHRQAPHAAMNDIATRSPGCTDRTPGPTYAKTPAPSWPPSSGNKFGIGAPMASIIA